VRERSPIPVFADESCHHLADVARLAGRVDGINLKIMKTGGVREMLRMIHAARAHGLKILLGSIDPYFDAMDEEPVDIETGKVKTRSSFMTRTPVGVAPTGGCWWCGW
jgi:hypothetical protein